jgi:hypothetical protein
VACVRIADVVVVKKIKVPDVEIVHPKLADSEDVLVAALHKYLQKTPR